MSPGRREPRATSFAGALVAAFAIAGCAKAPIAATPSSGSAATIASAAPAATQCDWQRLETCKAACNEGQGAICTAVAYVMMVGPPLDPAGAASFARRACDAQDIPGCVFLAELMIAGKGVEANEPVALSLLQHACDANDAVGCRLCGQLMERGSPPVEPNPRTALIAYDHACSRGDPLACSSLDRLNPTGQPARMPVVACSDPLEGVWIGQARREEQSDWYVFELTVRRAEPKSANLTGSIQVHYWKGSAREALPAACTPNRFEAVTTMTGSGAVNGDRLHFDGASPHVAVSCGSDSNYTPDRFEGTLAADHANLTWLDDRHADFKLPMVFRRSRCAAR